MYTATDKEKVAELLDKWYVEIRSRRLENARIMKERIDNKINKLRSENDETVKDQKLLLHYALLDFRYSYLVDNLGISKESFNEIEKFEKPTDDFLAYYYHFFKTIYYSETGNQTAAREEYEKAESLLEYISDELEKAEFYYRIATFYYYTQQALLSVEYARKAKGMYIDRPGHEVNVAFCDNVLGLACTYLREWALAEEHYTSSMDQFQKIGEERFILMVRHNLGWMYATQNLSELAIRYLSEVVEKSPNHYKAIYVKAKEHYKLKEYELARGLIERGLKISNALHQEEYQHRNMILKEINNNSCAEELEKVILAGITYFDREELFDNVQEYYEEIATKFYEEDQHVKASKYFHLGLQAKRKVFEKGALK